MVEETETAAEAYKQALACQSATLKALHSDAMAKNATDEECLAGHTAQLESLIALKTKMQANSTAALTS